uniref:Uncharacterized protein n=1 Tax=Magallana gigas TaxID=29159 RepID=K1R2B1_MAGGI
MSLHIYHLSANAIFHLTVQWGAILTNPTRKQQVNDLRSSIDCIDVRFELSITSQSEPLWEQMDARGGVSVCTEVGTPRHISIKPTPKKSRSAHPPARKKISNARHVGTSCLEERWDGQNDRQSNNLSSFLAHHYTISIPVLKRNTYKRHTKVGLIGSTARRRTAPEPSSTGKSIDQNIFPEVQGTALRMPEANGRGQ